MQRNKILSYLGLSTRAGHTVSGEFSVEKSVRARKARLVLVSEEASANTRKSFENLCTYYKVPICFFGSKEDLGRACGKEMRASAAIEDDGLARAVMKAWNEENGEGGKYAE